MKNFYYLAAGIVTILVTIMACEKSAIGVDEIQTLSKEEVLLSKGDDKVTICHWDAEEGLWYQITIAQEAVDKHFANHGDKFPSTYYEDLDGDGFGNPNVSVVDCEAPDGYVADYADCDDTKRPYSPEGDYVFKYSNTYSHDYTIDFFDGVNFTGYGGYPAGNVTYDFPYNQILSGTVTEDGVLSGMTTYENGGQWSFTGTVDECGGIISLDGDWELIE